MKTSACLLIASTVSLTAAEPLRQAAEARLWLQVPKNQAPLKDLRVSSGSVGSAHWEKDPALRERFADITFPIRWWKWSEITIRFTPAESGTAQLTLSGPWGADANQNMYRQEILWDQCSATGTVLQNGGFEETKDPQPASWSSSWAPYPAPGAWPLKGAQAMEGKQAGASWHNRPLIQTIPLTAGKEVSITLHAKAATLPDFVPPKAQAGDTPAHRECAKLKRGINFGNGWEVPPDQQWGLRFTTEDVDQAAREGFDHLRIPVAWHHHLKRGGNSWEISPKLLAELDPVLKRATDRNLRVLLDWHHFDDFTKNPDANLTRFIEGWETIARHYKNASPLIFFELLNEPCDRLTTEALGPIYQKTIRAIRSIDPERIIVASPGQWGQVGELERLILPDDDRVIVTVHCYEPFQFTHQGAGWVGLQDLKGIQFPGPPPTPFQLPASLKENSGVVAFVSGYNTLPSAGNPSSIDPVERTMKEAREWSNHFGRPVHLGEFGAHQTGDDTSRARYLRDVRKVCEQLKIPWTMWEWKAGFGYWDPQAGKARFREALFD